MKIDPLLSYNVDVGLNRVVQDGLGTVRLSARPGVILARIDPATIGRSLYQASVAFLVQDGTLVEYPDWTMVYGLTRATADPAPEVRSALLAMLRAYAEGWLRLEPGILDAAHRAFWQRTVDDAKAELGRAEEYETRAREWAERKRRSLRAILQAEPQAGEPVVFTR